ncbi:MAG TPA: lactate racemase domain-containing protein [Acidobacteriaceae bacterium]|nr:lactate racemase domain-containing protein [Acidobacteriaceae bacterium]
MSLYLKTGGPEAELSPEFLRDSLFRVLESIGPRRRVIAVPPDMSRLHSGAGQITAGALAYYGDRLQAVLPAVGTHAAMTPAELDRMFPGVPKDLFRKHNWRTDTVTLGEVPGEFIREQSEGQLHYSWPAQVNRMLSEGGFDLVLSIGQVVPHEVIGMANYNKNILIGTGGPLTINRSHYLGAVYGMERIMGRADTPVRRLLNYASDMFLGSVPIVYLLTVVSNNAEGNPVVRGLFAGDDVECFRLAAELSLAVNFNMLETPLQKAVVYLDPAEFKSTWLGNKAIYRTRMALADDAELIVLAPGVREFGEDPEIDKLIRKYGYRGTPSTVAAVAANPDLGANLSAAAHLIHGSSEGRFKITYCPGALSREEVESVGFGYAPLNTMLSRYDPAKLHEGRNKIDGEDVFFISNPALGLWATRRRFVTS